MARLKNYGLFVLLSVFLCGTASRAATPAAPRHTEEVTLKSGAVMIYDKNVPILTRDGTVVYGNVYRPKAAGQYPVIMAQGPYGKDVTFAQAYAPQYQELLKAIPDLCQQSSCRFLRWELADPERWIPDGYVVIVVDVRGTGYTPGFLDPFAPKEAEDYYDAIEWAGVQPWSNGKVGLLGVSFLAMNQWQVASLRPPHLAAIAPWEGASDIYREAIFHGGILNDFFLNSWFNNQVVANQNGNGRTAYTDPDFGGAPTGTPLDETTLERNRQSLVDRAHHHPLLDAYNEAINAKLENIVTPTLSAGNMAAAGLHGRGNYQGFVRISSTQKWLVLHTGTHVGSFYSEEGLELQHKFFDHFLKGTDNGWEKTPPVTLVVRDQRHTPYAVRSEQEWPLKRTQYTPFYLDARNLQLEASPAKSETRTSFEVGKSDKTFTMMFDRDVEFTGPVAAHFWVSSSTTDADLFVTLQMFDEQGKEITYLGASDVASPLAQGWLRVSQRQVDATRSKPYLPWHTHQEVQKLTPGRFYPVDVELWPTSVVAHPGYKLVMRVAGSDFYRPDPAGDTSMVNRGSGIYLHTDPVNRPMPEFAGTTAVATGDKRPSFLLLPIIPAQ
jgi:putative CocE/NonD family hydrolase